MNIQAINRLLKLISFNQRLLQASTRDVIETYRGDSHMRTVWALCLAICAKCFLMWLRYSKRTFPPASPPPSLLSLPRSLCVLWQGSPPPLMNHAADLIDDNYSLGNGISAGGSVGL